MATALRLGHSPNPNLSLHFTSIAPKLHFNNFSRYSSFSNPCCYPNRPLGHSFNPRPCALDNSSTPPANGKGEGDVVKGAVTASIVFACALSILNCGWKMNLKAMAAGPRLIYQKSPSISESMPSFGKMALSSLLDVVINMSSSKLEPPRGRVLEQLPRLPSKQDVDALKIEAIRLMKYGKPAEAEEFLQKALTKYKNEPEPVYNLEMALVELLISQGKYREALDHNCLQDEQAPFSDHRHLLYKAIIYTMLDKNKEAKRLWKMFSHSVGEMNPYKKP